MAQNGKKDQRPRSKAAEKENIMGKGIFSRDAILVLAACYCFNLMIREYPYNFSKGEIP